MPTIKTQIQFSLSCFQNEKINFTASVNEHILKGDTVVLCPVVLLFGYLIPVVVIFNNAFYMLHNSAAQPAVFPIS